MRLERVWIWVINSRSLAFLYQKLFCVYFCALVNLLGVIFHLFFVIFDGYGYTCIVYILTVYDLLLWLLAQDNL